jgi:predicted DNA binding CopG/RHH family protein
MTNERRERRAAPREHLVQIRVNAAELARIRALAAQRGLAVSSYLRERALTGRSVRTDQDGGQDD